MKENQVGIVGHGYVGGALHTLLERAYEPAIYDKFKHPFNTQDQMDNVRRSKVAFICVPTPMQEDKSCDLSAVEEVLDWLDSGVIVIKSTIPPGTTDSLVTQTGKTIIHNPEFLREQRAVQDILNATRTILGGEKKACVVVARIYQKVYGHDMVYVFTSAREAELVKYATNAFFALKVAFCNELFEICNVLGIDYDSLREHWLLEHRISRHHTIVTEERGFGGTCLPKDLNALIMAAEQAGYSPRLLREVWNSNTRFREEFAGQGYKK